MRAPSKATIQILETKFQMRNNRAVFAWGMNKEGELSLAKSIQTQFDMTGQVICVNNPEKVVGLRGENWPTAIASGKSHSIAIGSDGGVLSCGNMSLASTIIDKTSTKLGEDKFNPISALKAKKITQVSCGDYHTCAIS